MSHFLGDDIFISYSRADATVYAEALASRLIDKGFACYLDQYAVPPGRKLPPHVVKAARGSKMLVFIATEHALQSDYVRQEIDLVAGTGRPIVIIDPGGRFEELLPNEPTWQRLLGMARTPESMAAIAEGGPSEAVVRRIANAFQFLRKDQRLRRATRWVAVALVGMLVLFLATTGALSYQTRRVVKAKRDSAQALRDTQKAQSDTKKALDDATMARGKADDLQRAARLAQEATLAVQAKAAREAVDARKRVEAARREAASADRALIVAKRRDSEAHLLLEKANKLNSDNTKLILDSTRRLGAAQKKYADAHEVAEMRKFAGIDALARDTSVSATQRAVLFGMQSAERFDGTGFVPAPGDDAVRQSRDTCVDMTADGSVIATVDWSSRSVRLFSPSSGKELSRLIVIDPPTVIHFSRGGHYLAAAGSSRLYVWELHDQGPQQRLADPILSRQKGSDIVRQLAFTPDDRYLAYATADGELWMRDTNRIQEVRQHRNMEGVAVHLTFSLDGKYLAVADDGRLVHVYSVPDLSEVARMPSPMNGTIKALAFDRAGKFIGVAFGSQNVAFWRWQEATASIHAAARGR
jgi:hypothetical protein